MVEARNRCAWHAISMAGPDLAGDAHAALAIALTLQEVVDEEGMGAAKAPPPAPLDDPNALFDVLITEQEVRDTTHRLFVDGHYALAVEEAFKCVNNLVKRRTSSAADGAGLMTAAFSANSPLLKLNAMSTQSQRDQQQGYMQIYAGCMTGIRNPRAHEHRYLDEPHAAIEMLALANHLYRLAREASRTRARRRRTR